MNSKNFARMLNVWPPLLGAGIKVKSINSDRTRVEVEMKLRFWNRNIVGTHFGGSLYAMCDPFFMLILMENLGKDFIVWDKAASIKFLKPGKSHVTAIFEIPKEKVEEIRKQASSERKVEPTFTVEVKDLQGNVIAEVSKLLYVRRKQK